jgi:hypothetical protein
MGRKKSRSTVAVLSDFGPRLFQMLPGPELLYERHHLLFFCVSYLENTSIITELQPNRLWVTQLHFSEQDIGERTKNHRNFGDMGESLLQGFPEAAPARPAVEFEYADVSQSTIQITLPSYIPFTKNTLNSQSSVP